MNRPLLTLALLVPLLCGCVSDATRISRVKIGMTKDEVYVAMHKKPEMANAAGNVEYLVYDAGFLTRFCVRLRDGKVDAYGDEETTGLKKWHPVDP